MCVLCVLTKFFYKETLLLNRAILISMPFAVSVRILTSNCQYTIATSIVHSKLDYCNSLYFNLPNSQINRLQQIQNSLGRTVVKSPRFSHITPVLKSLHWLKVKKRIITISRPPTFSSVKITNRSFQYATPYLCNKLTLSVSLIHILVFHLLTTLHKSDPHCHHHLCHHQSILLFFTLDLKHTSSSSLFHHRLLHRYSLD